jgi:cytosine/adenosine deaminase-related metal-dependent hydrolase
MKGAGPPDVVLRGAVVAGDGVPSRRDLCLAGGRIARSLPRGAPVHAVPLPGHVVFPALVNAHDHLQLNAIPRPESIGVKPNSYAWIEAFQPLFEDPAVRSARAVPEAVRAWHGGLKNLLSGALLVAHHDPWQRVFDDPDFPVRVLRDFGWCHSPGLAGSYGPALRESYFATDRAFPWFIHLAEGTDQIAAGELDVLAASGALGRNSVLVHGLGLTGGDVERIAGIGAAVVWCPSSNLFMFGRTLDPVPLTAAGLLALGTDSRFTGAFDLLTELAVAARSSSLGPASLAALVTSRAAAILRVPEAGGLAPGQLADLLVLRERGGEPAEGLVSSRRADLRAVVRGGIPAIADPDFASWFEAAGERTVRVRVDGVPKLCAERYLRKDAVLLEPGLEIS